MEYTIGLTAHQHRSWCAGDSSPSSSQGSDGMSAGEQQQPQHHRKSCWGGTAAAAAPRAGRRSPSHAGNAALPSTMLRTLLLVLAGVALGSTLATITGVTRGPRQQLSSSPTLPSTTSWPEASVADAAQTLAAVGVQLTGLQRMRLDQLRLKRDLYERGRADARRAAVARDVAALGAKRRGVLVVAGGRAQLSNALVTLRVLREHLNSTLPVEIVHYGASELDAQAAAAIERFAARTAHQGSVSLIDGDAAARRLDLSYHAAAAPAHGYAAKVHALCFVTTLHEVLLLDGDSLPLLTPERLFETPEYAAGGSMFWPDFWDKLWLEEELFQQLGLDVPWNAPRAAGAPPFRSAESGQVLLDRARHFDVLEWLWFLNSHADVTYDLMLGDKDTFRAAFDLAGALSSHYQVPVAPRDALSAVLGPPLAPDAPPALYYAHQGMWQSAPDGTPAFLHRTAGAKLFPGCVATPAPSNSSEGSPTPTAAANTTVPRFDASCRVDWVTVPVSNDQMMPALAAGLVFNATQVDAGAYIRECDATVPADADRPDAPARCPALHGRNASEPVPLLPLALFPRVAAALEASYYAADAIAAELHAADAAADAAATAAVAAAGAGGRRLLRAA